MKNNDYKKMELPFKKVMNSLVFFLILFYPYNISFKNYLFKNQISILVYYLVAIATFIFINFSELKKGFKSFSKPFILKTLFIYIIIFFLLFFRNEDILHKHFGVPFFSFLFAFLPIVFMTISSWKNLALNCIILFTIEHIIGTFFEIIFPNIYLKNILPLFPDFNSELLYQFEHSQMAGITQHYSTNAAYLLIGLIVLIFCFKNVKKSKNYKVFYFLLLSSNIIALFCTGKRTQVIFGLLSILITSIVFNVKNIGIYLKKITKKNMCLSLVILLSSLLFLVLLPRDANPVLRTIDGIKHGDLFSSRKPMYDLAISTFSENKLFGTGWGSYKYIYFNSQILKERTYMDAHNIYLQLLCEVGIIGFLFVILFFIYNMYVSYKLSKNHKKDRLYLKIFFCYQIYILFEGIVGNAFYDIPVLFPYTIFVCMMVNIKYFQKKESKEIENKFDNKTDGSFLNERM